MNTAHHLYEGVRVNPEIGFPSELMGVLRSLLPSAIHFDVGGIATFIGAVDITQETLHTPYEVCWFEGYDSENRRVGAFTINNPGKSLQVNCFAKIDGKWAYFGRAEQRDLGESLNFDTPFCAAVFCVILRVCQTINCVNVRRVEHQPDDKLNKARIKRGKKPLFSYWTLELRGSKTHITSHGGGERTPARVHLVRGHIKRRKTGNFWWQPFARGDKKLGVIHKDYKLEAA